MLRSLLLDTAAKAKTIGGADFFVRYNPYLSARVQGMMQRFANDATRGSAETELAGRILRAGRRTSYGAVFPYAFAGWPLLQRGALQTTPQRFVNRRALLKIPAGTGGTSGIPLQLWRSIESIAAEQAFIDSLLAPFGYSMQKSRVAVLRADGVKPAADHAPPYGRVSHGGKRLTLSSRHLGPGTIAWFHEALSSFAPEVLWVYPSAAVNLHRLLAQANLPLTVPVVLSSSENLSPAVHTALEEYFHSTVVNYYGQAERVCFASGTKPGAFYFNPCYGRVELQPVPSENKNEIAAKIIGTTYWNSVMPLIRYDTGDTLSAPAGTGRKELEEIASGKRPFTAINGREGEYMITRDGVRIIGLNQIPREVKNVYQMQLVQTDPGNLRIDVLPMQGFGKEDADRIRDQARAKLPGTIAVSVGAVKELKTTKRGKTPFVIREFAEGQ